MKRLRHPIRAIREPFGTAGLVVAMIALVAALGGTALAASKLNSTQKKEVEKIAKKFAGKPGANGATGPAGPAGAKGDSGGAGGAGTNGTNGTNGTSATTASFSGNQHGCGEGGTEVKSASPTTYVCNGAEGEEGEEGQPAGFNYVFSSSTAATDPGSGKLALNAAPGSATTLSISQTDSDANDLEAVIGGWSNGPGAQGTLLIREAGDPATFVEYRITGANKASESEPFNDIAVTSVAGNGSFANGDAVTVAYWSSGSETLPIGAEETGTWAFSGTEAENGAHIETEGVLAPISFPIPLTRATTVVPREQIFIPADPEFGEHCVASATGVAVKSAEYGESHELETTLCIVEGELVNAELTHIWKPNFTDEGVNGPGGVLQFHILGPGLGFGMGTWAVRAE